VLAGFDEMALNEVGQNIIEIKEQLRQLFQSALEPLQDGRFSKERVYDLLTSQEKKIYDLFGKLQEAREEEVLLKPRSLLPAYFRYRAGQSPDSGLADEAAEILGQVLAELPHVRLFIGRIYQSREGRLRFVIAPFDTIATHEIREAEWFVHTCLVAQVGRERMAIDMALGQFLSRYLRQLMVSSVEQWKKDCAGRCFISRPED